METEKVQKKQYTSHIPTSFPDEATSFIFQSTSTCKKYHVNDQTYEGCELCELKLAQQKNDVEYDEAEKQGDDCVGQALRVDRDQEVPGQVRRHVAHTLPV